MSWLRSALMLAAFCACAQRPASRPPEAHTRAVGAVIPESGGEQRVLRGRKPITFKIDPLSVGSEHLFLGTELMPPGDSIPSHRHLGEEEAVFVHRGVIHVRLGDRRETAAAGATIFIPADTWIALQNLGADTAEIVYVFNEPSFALCLRAFSAPPGVHYVEPPKDSADSIRHRCHQAVAGS